MITELFLAMGVRTISSQTFAKGYYYEYSLEDEPDGGYKVTRRLFNRYEFANAEPETVVESDEQVKECVQAFVFNFPHAFNVDGSVAIDLTDVTGGDTKQDAPVESLNSKNDE